MKNYMMITPESLIKMCKCFSNTEEAATFMNHLADLTEELFFQGQLAKHVDEEAKITIIMKQICIMSLFVREHMELIHQLISSIDGKNISEDEMKKFREEK